MALFSFFMICSPGAILFPDSEQISNAADDNPVFEKKKKSPFISADSKAEVPLLSYKIVNSIKPEYYYTTEKSSFIPGESGLAFSNGNNIFFHADGFFSYKDVFEFRYELKYKYSFDERYFGTTPSYWLHRCYAKFHFHKMSVSGGVDNVNLGPGEFGLLLSDNTAPFPMFRLQTERPLEFLGKWEFWFIEGMINEDRDDLDDPFVMALRLSYSPFDFIRIGVTRLVMFNGKGEAPGTKKRPRYFPWRYPALLLGPWEDTPGGEYDNAAYTGLDLELNFFSNLNKPEKKGISIYFQYAHEDMVSAWNEPDSDSSRVFHYVPAFQYGVLFSGKAFSFRLEYCAVSKLFYSHHEYFQEGHSYKGLSLGYPFGRNSKSLISVFNIKPFHPFNLEAGAGVYLQPAFSTSDASFDEYFDVSDLFKNPSGLRMRRYFFSFKLDVEIACLVISAYSRIDFTDNYDSDSQAQQYTVVDQDRIFYVAGGSLGIKF